MTIVCTACVTLFIAAIGAMLYGDMMYEKGKARGVEDESARNTRLARDRFARNSRDPKIN